LISHLLKSSRFEGFIPRSGLRGGISFGLVRQSRAVCCFDLGGTFALSVDPAKQ
jgi:hypothetical protein